MKTKTIPVRDFLKLFLYECYYQDSNHRLDRYYESDWNDIDHFILFSINRTTLLLDHLIELNNWEKITAFLTSCNDDSYFLIYVSCMSLFCFDEICNLELVAVPTHNTLKQFFTLVQLTYTKYLGKYTPHEYSLWEHILDIESQKFL